MKNAQTQYSSTMFQGDAQTAAVQSGTVSDFSILGPSNIQPSGQLSPNNDEQIDSSLDNAMFQQNLATELEELERRTAALKAQLAKFPPNKH